MKERIFIHQTQWATPSNIQFAMTTRRGGVSSKPYDTFNLGEHVHDSLVIVKQNREILNSQLSLPSAPLYLHQVHGNKVIHSRDYFPGVEADAIVCDERKRVLAIMTADCLPILICNQRGTEVAAIHAGWRSLACGIIENTINKMKTPPSQLRAWLGPCIQQPSYEVGEDVLNAFIKLNPLHRQAFILNPSSKYQLDIQRVAETELNHFGLDVITRDTSCTFKQDDRFFSYRRDGQTGRMAALIWMET